MSHMGDDSDVEKWRPRPSLDAQRYNPASKMNPIISPTTASTTSTTILLPILLPSTAVPQANVPTQPFLLKELSVQAGARPSSSATPYIPQEIANADLAIAGSPVYISLKPLLTPF